ncbi:MAG: serine/threonine protein phosphatase, partial [Ruminococcus sp.]|nr:serine/threonine protein phosphatase [Ruminococcus sp.]
NPPAGASAVNSGQRVKEIADQWGKAMRDKGRVCDFVSVGDVSIRAIGADSQIIDCDVPVRHILEQIVAKLSVPPFLLGLSWSSTERMSAQQADILTSELDYNRSLITPVIVKIAGVYLRSSGLDPSVSVEWSNISLQDETELAQARLDNARAAQLEQGLEVNV